MMERMRVVVILGTAVILLALSARIGAQRQSDDPEPEIAESLAKERAARVSDLRYSLRFRIPANRTERITGHATIAFILADAGKPLARGFEPNGLGSHRLVNIGCATADAPLRNGHIVLPPSA